MHVLIGLWRHTQIYIPKCINKDQDASVDWSLATHTQDRKKRKKDGEQRSECRVPKSGGHVCRPPHTPHVYHDA